MKHRKQVKEASRIVKKYCIAKGEKFRLKDYDPADTNGVKSKQHAENILERRVGLLSDMQEKLYAQDRWALLLIFQAMDAAGKDGAIKHVMSGLNPQGVAVHAFRQPTDVERHHDYLWRASCAAPERGRIGIFNRSYYEDVLVVRVHPELLDPTIADPKGPGKSFWQRRYGEINAYERYLVDNGIRVVKFFLHISKDEQKKRLLKRLDDPSKHWKFSASDLQQRGFWSRYVDAYEHMLNATSTKCAPWYVIPADHKWFTRVAVADILVAELRSLDPRYPDLPKALRKSMADARAALKRE